MKEYSFEYKKLLMIPKKCKIKMQNTNPSKNKTNKTGIQTLQER